MKLGKENPIQLLICLAMGQKLAKKLQVFAGVVLILCVSDKFLLTVCVA